VICEELCHLRGRLEVPLIVQREELPRSVEMRVIARTGEDIEHRPLFASGMEHSIRGEDWEALRRSEFEETIVD
jgi:hypothetical protein